jgi:branched-chain amino acid transport system substrate-binding protein
MWTGKRALRLGAAVFCLAGVLVGMSGGAASAAKAPIVIGMVTDETGAEAATFVDDTDGAIARIDAQNAKGGVDGHKLVLDIEDDQSTVAGNLTASQTLVEDKGAFGLIQISSTTYGAASYLQKKGIPVVGFADDGTEWGQQPNSNMFSVSGILTSPINGRIYSYNGSVQIFKDLGVTKLATVVANVPSAIQAGNSLFAAAKSLGISKCLDDVVPLGAVDFTTFALQMKQLGCNGIEVLHGEATCIGVQTALVQAGLAKKVPDYCVTSYDQSLLSQPTALQTMQGTYTQATVNVLGNDIAPPVKVFLNNLHKYTSWPGGLPSLELLYSYESADLFIKGLESAGGPNQKTFISKLRNLNNWTSEGLITAPGDDFQHFGTLAGVPKKSCAPLLELKGKSFVPALGGKPVCGTLVSSPAPG